MVSFIVDETHLRRLSPAARKELLQVLSSDLAELRGELTLDFWDAESNWSYPLDADEARRLIRGIAEPGKRMLRVFCTHIDGEVGCAELPELLDATGFTRYDELGQEVSVITQRLKSISGNPDAWLFNWHAKDWEWDETEKTYAHGKYFISTPAIDALRQAFSMEK